MYKPLPKQLTIKNSPIEGLGIFATEDIKKNTFMGITHIRDEQFENNFDLAAEDLRLATRHLGMIVGKVDVEEILGSIFSDFCIGK